MSTLVCFHAHPDDEATSTGGLMAKAAAAGHRVVLVTATNGELGEPTPGVLGEGEELWERRMVELAESARHLGAEVPRLLGYRDSGMMGEATNDDPRCFWQAGVDQAADRMAEVIADLDVDVLTIYDDHGLYGHPDHIQVHRVGLAVAERIGVTNVYEATINRDRAREGFSTIGDLVADAGMDAPPELPDIADDFGVAEIDLAYHLDVSAHVAQKRAALAAHRSQVPDESFFLSLPDEVLRVMFGTEWFAVPGDTGQAGPSPVDLLPGL